MCIDAFQIFNGLIGGTVGIDEGFDKRVTGKPVGAMQSGTGGLADGIQLFDIGAPHGVSGNAATHVVGRGYDGNRFHGHIDPKFHAPAIYIGKALFDKGGFPL